jgi:hypothetical protein
MMMAMMIQRHKATTIAAVIATTVVDDLIATTVVADVIATVIATVTVLHAKSANQLLVKMMF